MLYTLDEEISPYDMNNIALNVIKSKYIIDVCFIDKNISILYQENLESQNLKHLFIEIDNY